MVNYIVVNKLLNIVFPISGVFTSIFANNPAEPLSFSRGTLGFRGTPVENHCIRGTELTLNTRLGT